jgi:serine/threonine protein kinase
MWSMPMVQPLPPTSRPAEGKLLGGRYRLAGELGVGGMATVYRAHDDWLKREVAVKVIAERKVQDMVEVRRFRREARLAARLTHQNIVRILDAGVDPEDFIVMEIVEGIDAAKLVKRTGRLSLRHTLRVIGPICTALHYAHGTGVIHGDVSASNILIAEGEGTPKLADFGLASDTADLPEKWPRNVSGTPGYMAPELLDGAAPSPRSDLYSIAAVTHRLLTATTALAPVRTTAPLATTAVRLPELADERDDLPHMVTDAVAQALSPDPDDRQASVAEFRAQLIREAAVPFSLATAA